MNHTVLQLVTYIIIIMLVFYQTDNCTMIIKTYLSLHTTKCFVSLDSYFNSVLYLILLADVSYDCDGPDLNEPSPKG